MNAIGLKTGGKIFVHTLLFIYTFICLAPFILILSVSLTSEDVLAVNGYTFWPDKFSLDAYKYILSDAGMFLKAYGVTITVTLAGTFLGLLVISLYSYVLSRNHFKYRRFFTWFAIITMLFNGGLVPSYLVITQLLHLQDTLLALIVPYLTNSFYIIIMRTFFVTSIPEPIIESAKIDGAGEYRIFFTIVIQISLPAFATIGLFLALIFWNDWWLPLLYINSNTSLYNVQYLLYKIQSNIAYLTSGMVSSQTTVNASTLTTMPAESARMAMAVLVAGPIVIVFPFVQKYFVKGLTLGSVKG